MPTRSRGRLLGLLTLATLTVVLARPAEAQSGQRGRLEGTVTDSVHARPLAGVRVVAVAADSRPDPRGVASTDSTGRYHIDSLPSGRYLVGFESPLLDSLEITLTPREVAVNQGAVATVDLALPPAAKLRSAVCSGASLPADKGVLYGHVVDAATEAPLIGSVVTVVWREISVDRQTLRSESNLRTTSATVDSTGWYRVCGVPTGTWLSFLVQNDERLGTAVRTIVDDSLGVAIRHLSLDQTGPVVGSSETDSAAVAAGVASGTARLAGVVRGPAGQPLSSAELRVVGTNVVGRSDAAGRYALGGLPAGTQVLVARRVGYTPTEVALELRSNATIAGDVRMERVVILDSVRVVALRSRYREFEQRRKMSTSGIFLGPEEMERWQRYPLMSDVVRLMGVRVVGDDDFPFPQSSRPGLYAGPCRTNIVINGAEYQSLRDVNPRNVGAIAVNVSILGCGVIEIWTKR